MKRAKVDTFCLIIITIVVIVIKIIVDFIIAEALFVTFAFCNTLISWQDGWHLVISDSDGGGH